MLMKAYPFDKYGYSEIRVIDDTDCACEGDDAFAIAHLLMTSKFDIRAINAANFRHEVDSVQRSYDAIVRLLDAMDLTGRVNILHGSMPMKSETEYEISEASNFIVEEAMRNDSRPLFVVSHGAITNIAVALQTRPEIAGRMHCIWIGGAPYPDGGWEFNLSNDVVASRVVMNSEMTLWQVPANAYSMMRVSFSTLMENVYPNGKAGKYLCEQLWECNREKRRIFNASSSAKEGAPGSGGTALLEMSRRRSPESYATFASGDMWQLGDSPVVGLMLNCQIFDRTIIGAPYINDDSTYTLRPDNPHKIAVYQTIDSQFIFNDFFSKLRYQFGSQQ